MKYIYGLISSFLIFISLSFICPPSSPASSPLDMLAIASNSDILTADSITSGAITLKNKELGDVVQINRPLSDEEITDVTRFIPVTISTPDDQGSSTAADIVKYLVSLFGGLLTTLLLYFLHKKFPEIFPSSKLKDYKKNDDEKTV
jgi:hypothetical protein